MTDIAIKVENLSKRYRIGLKEKMHENLAEALTDFVIRPLRNLQRLRKLSTFSENGQAAEDIIWALKHVSFEVRHGDIFGIIGRNGAGKSTLLKILSRITNPTEGQAFINGRVGSLLEVGTGFHGELTGRENVYLNGTILGMKKKEIDRKFDEIVAFAEVEKFIDTPVKRYSSGMNVRLAFAVAAHLEPEILLVDEVLAVGDFAFQKKCLGKMHEVGREGRTVLFVSHNMATVENLCKLGMVLEEGRVRFIGTQTEAIANYLSCLSVNTVSLRERDDHYGSGELRIVAIEFKDSSGHPLEAMLSGQDVDVYLHYELNAALNSRNLLAGIVVSTQLEAPVFLHHNYLTKEDFGVLPQKGAFVCRIKKLPLTPSTYRLGYGVMKDGGRGGYLDRISDAASLTVVEGDYYGTGQAGSASHGPYLVNAAWRLGESDS